ncbi:MAG TPA: DUF4126 family protein [Solirubrobacteraceae bacterium]|jgi:hypothetical protein
MNSLPFYIGLGLGLAIAAGLRPFLPALLAGALGSAGDLGIGFAHGRYHFLQSSWWLVILATALVASYALQLRSGSAQMASGPLGAASAGIAIGVGALLFAGTLAEHGDMSWPGLLAGALAAALASAVAGPVLDGARKRLPDRGAREALTLYVDGGALLVAALVALAHPLGYVALALILWMALASRRRTGEKYAGLRILRR